MESKKSSPKKNFLYNFIYHILILLIPLITAPYLSRVVNAEGVGIYSYTYSIVNYFMLFVILGVNNYGNRTIAKVRENLKELSKNFWGIYLFQLFMGISMLVLYLIYLHFFVKSYKEIAFLQIFYIISSIVDINWFYFGLEEFKMTITRNSIVKVISLVLIFILVRTPQDLWKYVLIMSGTTMLSQLLLWLNLRKWIYITKIEKNDIIKHIKPNLILFIPVIAVSLYKIMDKIMLGAISNIEEVGYYENAEKIINVPTVLINTLGTVMLPRMANIVSKGDENKLKEYINKSISFALFMAFPMCFGLIGIGREFAPIYFGQQFEKTGILIILLSVTLPFVAFANVLRTQYLIPKERDKEYIISVILGAVVNFVINSILIAKIGSIGACIGTIAAECTVMIYQTAVLVTELPVKQFIKNIMPFLVKSMVMFFIVILISTFKIEIVSMLILQILIAIIVYTIMNFNYINSIVNLKTLLKNILRF